MITKSENLLCVCNPHCFVILRKTMNIITNITICFCVIITKIYYFCCKINKKAFSWFSIKENSVLLFVIYLNFWLFYSLFMQNVCSRKLRWQQVVFYSKFNTYNVCISKSMLNNKLLSYLYHVYPVFLPKKSKWVVLLLYIVNNCLHC